MSAAMLAKQFLFDDMCRLVVAYLHGRHVGHVFYCTFSLADGRRGRWGTQLVVARDVRGRGVASAMLACALAGRCSGPLHAFGLRSSSAQSSAKVPNTRAFV
jgi:GNAT superfamily N-acetyltransferase